MGHQLGLSWFVLPQLTHPPPPPLSRRRTGSLSRRYSGWLRVAVSSLPPVYHIG